MQLLPADHIFQEVAHRNYRAVHTIIPALAILSAALFVIYRASKGRYRRLESFSIVSCCMTLALLFIGVYCTYQDKILYSSIKANPAETCGTIILKKRGGGRTVQRVRYSYVVADKEYESEELVYDHRPMPFDSILGHYIVIYNASNPGQCVLDVYRRCK